MKKRRIARGHPALMIPSIPNQDIFYKRFSAFYGYECATWLWGYVTAHSMFRIIKEVCESRYPTAEAIKDITNILSNLRLLA
jgi:hypothetical protein